MQGRHLAIAAASALAAALATAPAQAASTPTAWQCRASALATSFDGNAPADPVVAGGGEQCTNSQAGLPTAPQSAGAPPDAVTAGTLTAQTTIQPATGPAAAQVAGALGKVEGLAVQLPGGAAATTLGVREAIARASGACVNGAPRLTGASEVTGVMLGGQEVPAEQLTTQLAAALAPLSPVVDVKLGEELRDGASLVRRALHVTVLSAAGTPLLDVVAGEARVGTAGAVCADTAGGPDGGGGSGGGGGGTTLPPGIKACPDGSVLDAGSGFCVIRGGVAGTSASGSHDIIVGRPFEGPSGGTVVPLGQARKRYRSACLSGSGPQFAIVGTAKPDRITGTNRRDRILTLGGSDRVDGGRAGDCIDGGTGADSLNGALGDDRVIGGPGGDALNGGPGRDRLEGGAGNDALNAAYGRDLVLGGAGGDVINVATAGPAATVNCGSGRDKARANGNEARRLKGCEVRYVLPDRRTKR